MPAQTFDLLATIESHTSALTIDEVAAIEDPEMDKYF
jgi:hypothetical protein